MFFKKRQFNASEFQGQIKKILIGQQSPTSRRKPNHVIQLLKHGSLSKKLLEEDCNKTQDTYQTCSQFPEVLLCQATITSLDNIIYNGFELPVADFEVPVMHSTGVQAVQGTY